MAKAGVSILHARKAQGTIIVLNIVLVIAPRLPIFPLNRYHSNLGPSSNQCRLMAKA